MEDTGEEQRSIAVFDICDTLYYSNTTHDFVRFVVEGEHLSPKTVAYKLLNSRWLPFRYFLIALSLRTGRDLLREFNVRILKGKSRNELLALAGQFVDNFLVSRRVPQIQELLRKQLAASRRVVLCSSSIEPVVAAIAESLSVEDHVHTSLEYENEVFTGRIAEDVTSKKVQALESQDLLGDVVLAVSDNTTDLELLTSAKEALAVVHRNKKKAFWKRHNLTVINLD